MILRTWVLAMASVAIALVMAACSTSSDVAESSAVQVVATTTMLGDIASNVVGEDGAVRVLFPIGASPHDYQPSSADVAAIYAADLVLANGLGLEEILADVLHTARDDGVNVVEVAELLDPERIGDRGPCDPDSAGDEHAHEGEHDEGMCDPHVWFDPERDVTTAVIIADALAEIDASKDWAGSADEYGSDLMEADAEIVEKLAMLSSQERMLVTNHDSFGYFAGRYGFEVIGTVIPGGSSITDPSSADLAELVGVINETGVSAIFTDTTESKALARAIAGEVDHDVAVIPLHTGSLGETGSGADTLIGMLKSNADRIVGGLA